MAKYKLCPSCNEQNDPRNMECSKCGLDLMGVAIMDTDMPITPEASTLSEIDDETDAVLSDMVRICACGEINPAQARKCQNCHEDISDILPVNRNSHFERHYQLSFVGIDYTYQVPCGSLIIGREHGMREILAERPFVSRAHAKLTVDNGELYIENLSTTNYTYVNNVRIPLGRVKLNVGDEVALGGIAVNGDRQENAAYFIVGIV